MKEAYLKERHDVRKKLKDLKYKPKVFQLYFECSVSWEDMQPTEGQEKARFCEGCEKNVYDLLDAKDDDLLAIWKAHGNRYCAQVMVRQDNRVVYGNCKQQEMRTARGKIRASFDPPRNKKPWLV